MPDSKSKRKSNQEVSSDIGKDIESGSAEFAEQQQEEYDLFILNLKKKEKEVLASEDSIAKAKKSKLVKQQAEEIASLEKIADKDEALIKRIEDLKRQMHQTTIATARVIEENNFKFGNKQKKAQMLEERKETARKTRESAQERMAELAATKMNGNTRNKYYRELRAQIAAAQQEEIDAEEQKRKIIENMDITRASDWQKRANDIAASFEATLDIKTAQLGDIDAQIAELEAKIEKRKKEDPNNPNAGVTFQKEIEKLLAQKEEIEDSMGWKGDKGDQFKEEGLANLQAGLVKGFNQGLSKLGAAFSKAVDEAIDIVGANKSHIDARLQTLEDINKDSYTKIARQMKSVLSVSPYVKQKDMLQKVTEAVDAGISYNVEQRAFLATVADKIASTFDAFDSNLMRIIRLQQADTTVARLGVEAYLTRFFNSTFQDTSYLTDSAGYDAVSGALIDANAQMTRDMSIAFEFNVQKWLGSLSSLGFGTDTISKIATGINYLGSGNVQALAGDTQLQSLLAMSASRAGLSYSELLVKGIDDSTANQLLKSMVQYLKEIAEDKNAVVKAAYGDVFSFSQADLRAVKNLTSTDIDTIFNASMTTSDAVDEVNKQLQAIANRLSTTEKINNVFDNILYSAGETVANNTATALTWKMLSVIEEATGGIHLPAISVMGNMVDLSTFTIEGIAKTGIFGIGLLSQVPNMISSLAKGGGIGDIGSWNASEYTSRGKDFKSTVGGVQATTSSSKSIITNNSRFNYNGVEEDEAAPAESKGSESSSDLKKESLSSTSEDQETMSKSSEEKGKEHKNVEDLYKEIFENKTAMYVFDAPLNLQLKSVIGTSKGSSSGKFLLTYDDFANKKLNSIDGTLSDIRDSVSDGLNTLTSVVVDYKPTTVAAAVNSRKGASLFDGIQKTLSVRVANIDETPVTEIPDITVPNTITLTPASINDLATKLYAALQGVDMSSIDVLSNGGDRYTLRELIRKVMDGQIATTVMQLATGGTTYNQLEQIRKDMPN